MQNKTRITIASWMPFLGDKFSYSCENNTVKKTVEEAVRRNISLAFADLSYTILRGTILCYANLSGADLNHADLKYAILSDANLLGANLSDAKIDYPMGFPDGEFIGWKKVIVRNKSPYIIKLKVLADSKRSRGITDKCRCDKALVLEIQNLDGSKTDLTKVVNNKIKRCPYEVGKIVKADSWDENRFNECSHGIHFFLDREKAVDY